jgi:hypothetical protein
VADRSSRWDTQTLGFGLAVGLVGVVLLLGRDGTSLRPVHLLGVVILGFGAAVLIAALDRGPGGHRAKGPAPLDDE